MEATLQLVANVLKGGLCRSQVRRQFLMAAEKATQVFDSDDERTIWILITIDLVYQTYLT